MPLNKTKILLVPLLLKNTIFLSAELDIFSIHCPGQQFQIRHKKKTKISFVVALHEVYLPIRTVMITFFQEYYIVEMETKERCSHFPISFLSRQTLPQNVTIGVQDDFGHLVS